MIRSIYNFSKFFGRDKRRLLLKCQKAVYVLLLLGISISASAFSQGLKFPKKRLTIEQIFDGVKKQTGLTAIYDNGKLNKSAIVELPQSSMELDAVLKSVLSDKNLSYEVKDDYLIIIPVSAIQSQEVKDGIKITGTVKDEEGAPLPGATVAVKGSTGGTVTDFDGKYTLEIPAGGKPVLVFSFVGMKPQEVAVGNKRTIDVVLILDSKQIGEVVVTGYQKIDRRLFTGSASKLRAKDVELAGVSDASQFLQGQAAGVSVDNVSGTFGAAPVVRIRGNASINGNNKPLWVVDGVILEDLVQVSADDLTSGNLATVLSSGVAGLNPDDIEDIQVLKDASATALYGAQAMNGVIVINTKKGKAGKLKVNYSGSFAVKERPNYSQFDIANSDDEIYFYKELYRKGWVDVPSSVRARDYGVMGKMFNRSGNIWGANGGLDEEFLAKYGNANTDWFNVLFKNAITHQHSLSFSGGSEKATYYASISAYEDEGRTIADNVSKYTGTMRGNFKISDKFSIGVKLSVNHRNQRLPGSKDREFNAVDGVYNRDFDINPFSYALNTSRSMRPYDENGNLEFFRRDYSDFNIIHELEHNYVNLTAMDVVGQVNLDYQIMKNLTVSSIGQVRRNTAHREHIIHEKSNQANAYRAASSQFIRNSNTLLFSDPDDPNGRPYTVLPLGGFYNTVDNTLDFYSIRNSVSWNPNIGDIHLMSFLLGQEIKSTERTEIGSDGWGIQYDRGGLYSEHPDLSKYLSLNNQNRERREEFRDKYIGYFFNAAYSYDGRYTLNGTIRRDGSNQLGKTEAARYLTSWNVSAKWNVNEEPFFENIETVNLLSLKATYGLNGVMGPSASAIQKLEAYQTWRPYDKETGVSIEDLTNKDLSWEKMYELSLGVEAAFFNNRIYTDAAYYRRTSFDLIGAVRTSAVGGESIKFGNFADMKTEGFELTLNTVNLKTTSFKWITSVNLDYSVSEITQLENYNRIGDYVRNTGGNYIGKPRRGLYSIRFDGLTNQGLPKFVDSKGEPINEYLNLQERRNVMDYLKYEGVLDAPLSGGFTNTFSYKAFSMSVGLVFRVGNKIRLDDLYSTGGSGLSRFGFSSISKDLENRFIVPGDENITDVPAIIDRRFDDRLNALSLNLYEMYNKSDLRVADGSFVRLKTVSFGYNLPKNFVENLGLQNVRVSLQGQNLWLIYSDKKLNGLDPEFYRSGGVALPVARTYTFALNIGF